MALLEYEFRIIGKNVVDQALASIERRIAQHNALVNRQFGVTSRGARAASATGTDAHQASRARASAEKRAISEIAAAERDLARQQAYWHRARQQSNIQRHREELRQIKERERAEKRAADLTAREARRVRAERERMVRGIVGGVGSRALGTAASVGRTGAAMVGISGSFLAAASISQALKLDEAARRFAVAGREPGERGMDPEAIRKRVMQVSIASGVAPEAVMSGLAGFQAMTGESEFALKAADMFATFAQATGASFDELTGAAAALFQNFDIRTVEEMGDALARLTMQGKKGSFELRDLAARLPQITAALAGKGVGAEALPQIGAIAQIVQRSFGRGPEAAARTTTAIDAMFRQIIAKSEDLESGEAFGGRSVQVFNDMDDPTSGMRTDLASLIADIVTASRGDVTQLQKVFGDEGRRGVEQFVSEFQRASEAAGGGERGAEAGKKAVLALIDSFAGVEANMAEIQRDAADNMKATAVQLEILNTKLKDAISSEFFPALERVAPHLERLVPAVATLAEKMVKTADWFARNPFSGLGAVLAGLITIEIAKGAIGPKVADAIVQLILRTTGRPPTSPTPPGGTPPVVVGGPGGGAGAPKPGGGRFGRLAGAGGKLLGAGSGALFGHGMGTLVGGAAGGEKGAETLGRVGAGAGAGSVLGPLGVLAGGAVGLFIDSLDSLLTQLEPMGDFFQEMKRLGELDRRATERLEDAKRNGGRAPVVEQFHSELLQSLPPTNMSVDPMMSTSPTPEQQRAAAAAEERAAKERALITEIERHRDIMSRLNNELERFRAPDLPNRTTSPSPVKG